MLVFTGVSRLANDQISCLRCEENTTFTAVTKQKKIPPKKTLRYYIFIYILYLHLLNMSPPILMLPKLTTF